MHMKMKMMIFGLGVITGAATLMTMKPCRKAMMEMAEDANREIHATKKILLKKGKHLIKDVEDESSDISDDIRDLVETVVEDLESIDTKELSNASKRVFGKLKTHALSLKNLVQ